MRDEEKMREKRKKKKGRMENKREIDGGNEQERTQPGSI